MLLRDKVPSPDQLSFPLSSDEAWARSSDPATSQLAAAHARRHAADRLSRLVVQALEALGEATSKEVAEYLQVDPWSISPRFRPLARKRVIEECGTRKSVHGTRSLLWRRVR